MNIMEVYLRGSLMSVDKCRVELSSEYRALSFLQEMANNKIAARPVLIVDLIPISLIVCGRMKSYECYTKYFAIAQKSR
jgi:hypothetical protein